MGCQRRAISIRGLPGFASLRSGAVAPSDTASAPCVDATHLAQPEADPRAASFAVVRIRHPIASADRRNDGEAVLGDLDTDAAVAAVRRAAVAGFALARLVCGAVVVVKTAHGLAGLVAREVDPGPARLTRVGIGHPIAATHRRLDARGDLAIRRHRLARRRAVPREAHTRRAATDAARALDPHLVDLAITRRATAPRTRVRAAVAVAVDGTLACRAQDRRVTFAAAGRGLATRGAEAAIRALVLVGVGREGAHRTRQDAAALAAVGACGQRTCGRARADRTLLAPVITTIAVGIDVVDRRVEGFARTVAQTPLTPERSGRRPVAALAALGATIRVAVHRRAAGRALGDRRAWATLGVRARVGRATTDAAAGVRAAIGVGVPGFLARPAAQGGAASTLGSRHGPRAHTAALVGAAIGVGVDRLGAHATAHGERAEAAPVGRARQAPARVIAAVLVLVEGRLERAADRRFRARAAQRVDTTRAVTDPADTREIGPAVGAGQRALEGRAQPLSDTVAPVATALGTDIGTAIAIEVGADEAPLAGQGLPAGARRARLDDGAARTLAALAAAVAVRVERARPDGAARLLGAWAAGVGPDDGLIGAAALVVAEVAVAVLGDPVATGEGRATSLGPRAAAYTLVAAIFDRTGLAIVADLAVFGRIEASALVTSIGRTRVAIVALTILATWPDTRQGRRVAAGLGAAVQIVEAAHTHASLGVADPVALRVFVTAHTHELSRVAEPARAVRVFGALHTHAPLGVADTCAAVVVREAVDTCIGP